MVWAQVPEQVDQTKVLTYAGGPNDHWIAVGVGGSESGGTAIEQLRLPPAFAAQMRSVLAPGTTLVVTDASLTPASTGVPTTVLAAAGGAH